MSNPYLVNIPAPFSIIEILKRQQRGERLNDETIMEILSRQLQTRDDKLEALETLNPTPEESENPTPEQQRHYEAQTTILNEMLDIWRYLHFFKLYRTNWIEGEHVIRVDDSNAMIVQWRLLVIKFTPNVSLDLSYIPWHSDPTFIPHANNELSIDLSKYKHSMITNLTNKEFKRCYYFHDTEEDREKINYLITLVQKSLNIHRKLNPKP